MIAVVVALVALAALAGFSRWETGRIEARFPPAGRIVEAGGARIHLTEMQPAQAPRATVLLIHGASGNQADMMAPLGRRLVERGFRVVAADRPGHGYSARLADAAASPAAQAKAIRAALKEIGVTRAIVVGHSWAGSVAVNLLLDQQDFTEGALLLAPVTHPWPGGVRWYYKLAAAPVAGWLFANCIVTPLGLALMDGAIGGVFAPNPTPPDYAERIGAKLALRPDVFRANAEDVANLRAFLERQAPRMGAIARPVHILTGDHDGVVLTERHSWGSARDIPGATLEVLPGVGHSPHWTAPDTVAAAIDRLADRVQTARETRPETPASAPSVSSR